MFSAIFPPAIGGPATQSFNLCKALIKNNVVPVVVTYHESKTFSCSNKDGFNVYMFKSIYTGTVLDKIIRWIVFPFYIFYIIKKEKVQIVHCHSVSVLSFMAAAIAKLCGLPTIVKFAGDWVWETLSTSGVKAKDNEEIHTYSTYARFLTVVQKLGLKFFDKIWVVSEFRRGNIRKLLGTDEKVIVINNCLLLTGGHARTWGNDETVIVISANRFIPHKRLDFMVQLFAEMNIPNSKLVMIGSGDQKEIQAVKDAIKKFNLEGKVELPGKISFEEIYDRFSKASFYISTSIEEGFPNVYIEAMNYGLPVIATDEGGSKELVLDQKTGYMFVPSDHEKIVETMRKLAVDIPLRTELSKNSYERSRLFNLEIRVKDFIQMYQNLLQK